MPTSLNCSGFSNRTTRPPTPVFFCQHLYHSHLKTTSYFFSLSNLPAPPYTELLAKSTQCFLNQEVPPFPVTASVLLPLLRVCYMRNRCACLCLQQNQNLLNNNKFINCTGSLLATVFQVALVLL